MVLETVDTYRFTPDDLMAEPRRTGISAFMRIRNGEDFLESTIRSHIDCFDEIVAVYNRCTDATPDILARLQREYGPDRLRVVHYLPDVYPPGSEGHQREAPDSPHSLVNYYNLALSKTRHTIATKLDDDHLAIGPKLRSITAEVRRGAFGANVMACFCGFNLDHLADGNLGLPSREMITAAGDKGYFQVSPATYFVHDQRFEKFRRAGLKRTFTDVAYWHLKYLKNNFGFANYDLSDNPESRYNKKLEQVRSNRNVVRFADLDTSLSSSNRLLVKARRLGVPLPEKAALISDHWLKAIAYVEANRDFDLNTLPINSQSPVASLADGRVAGQRLSS